MKSDGLAKLYDTLTADERFRLTVEALAREDKPEIDRLHRSCPRRTYTRMDVGYTERYETGAVLTLASMVELAPRLAKLQMVEAFRVLGEHLQNVGENAIVMAYLAGFEDGAEAARQAEDRNGKHQKVEADEAVLDAWAARAVQLRATIEALCDQLRDLLAVDARMSWDAFAEFCREELGLAPETVVTAWARPLLPRLQAHRAALDAAQSDAKDVETLATVLHWAWRREVFGDTDELVPEIRDRVMRAEDG